MVVPDIQSYGDQTAPYMGDRPYAMRIEIMSMLCDILASSSDRLNTHERLFAADIIATLWPEIPLPHRLAAAERFINFSDLPASLIKSVVTDELQVAQCFLEHVKNIPDAILIAANDLSADHCRQVAQRSNLSAHVIERVVARNDSEAMAIILNNEGATISSDALDMIIMRSQHDSALQMPVLKRPEFTLRHGFAMFWWVGPQLRRAILSRFSIDRSFIQNAVSSLFPRWDQTRNIDPVTDNILKLIERRHNPRGQNGEKISRDILEQTLEHALGNSDPAFIEAISLLANIKEITAERILHDMGGEAYAVICKSLGVARQRFSQILENASIRGVVGIDLSPAHREFLLETFDLIGRDYARTIVRYWDWLSGELVGRGEMAAAMLEA